MSHHSFRRSASASIRCTISQLYALSECVCKLKMGQSGFQVYHADVAPKHLRSHTQRLSQPKPLLTDMPSMNHSSTVDSPTSVPHSGSLSHDPHDAQSLPSSMYDAIVVTRLDVLGLVTLHSSLGALLQSVRRGGSGSTRFKVGKNSATSKWDNTIIAGGHGNRRYALLLLCYSVCCID